MKKLILYSAILILILFSGCSSQLGKKDRNTGSVMVYNTIQYHRVRISTIDGSILPWFSSDKGKSYDTCLMLVWNFWNKMETNSNGLKYYINHQVWKTEHDMRGLGGDQFNMALSSWALLMLTPGIRK